MTSFLTKVFYPLFFLLFLLSFFLIEGEYRFYLFSFWAIFLFCFNKQAKKNELTEYKISKPTIFALVLSILFAINLIFSRQAALSIEKLLFYLVSLAIFIFFSSLSKSSFKPKTFFYYLSILTLVLNIIVLFFTFYKDQQGLFPGMNLLVRSYGHNHYAAFLLLLIPIFWWQFLFKHNGDSDKETHFLMVVLLISSYLLVILSLARLALFISLVQLVIIFFTNKKIFPSLRNDDLVKVIIKTFIFAFLSIGLVFLFLSTPLNKKGENLCPLIISKKEICKPLMENDRFIYWQKAWLIFKENPIFGVGLKNFNFASRQFPIKDQRTTSSYAHNIFLHNLAEGGLLVGGFFVLFIIYIFHRSFLIIKSSDEPIYKFLWLAAATSFLNAMFDFDWHFFIIFTLTLIFLAIILQNDTRGIATKTNYFKKYYFFITIITTFFAICNFMAQIAYKINKPELIVEYLPYSDKQVRLLLSEKKLVYEDFLALYPIYRNDVEFLFRLTSLEQSDSKKKIVSQIEYANLDPPSFINNVEFGDYDFETARPLADKLVEVVYKYNFLNNLSFLDYWDQRNFAQQFFNFANEAYLANDLPAAVNYYQKAILLDEFVMGDRKAVFLTDTDFIKLTAFFKNFQDFDPENMGPYFYDHMALYKKVLLYLFENNLLEDFFVLADEMFQKQPNFSWFLWSDLITNIDTQEDKQKLQMVYDRYQSMTTWREFLPLPE